MVHQRWSRAAAVALVTGLLAPFMVPAAMHGAEAAPACGRRDRPETGVAGDVPLTDQLTGRADEGYNCGLALVGYSSLGGRGGNGNMAWSGDCAYIAGDGVAIVDVRDPAHPRHTGTLHAAGADATIETLHAVDAPGRSLLATGRYGLFGLSGGEGTAPVDIWDTRDCSHPKHLTTIQFPANVHNLTFTADGKRLWSTLPLRAFDLTDLARPKLLPDIEPELAADGYPNYQYAHEAWPSPDGTRLYVGGQFEPINEELLVVNTEGWPARKATVEGRIALPGHSIRPMRINGKPFLLNSDESILNPVAKGCLPNELTPFAGASRPYLTDISNEHYPQVRGELRLPINDPIHCGEQTLSGVNASVHYQDADDADDTTFTMSSMWNAGLRIHDVRDPAHPREVAYFNPGTFPKANPLEGDLDAGTVLGLQNPTGLDQAWAHVRYRPATGHIWLTTATGGFWVLELEPQVRKALGLPAKPTAQPDGAIPRPAATRGSGTVGAAAMGGYCTLNSATSVVASGIITRFGG